MEQIKEKEYKKIKTKKENLKNQLKKINEELIKAKIKESEFIAKEIMTIQESENIDFIEFIELFSDSKTKTRKEEIKEEKSNEY